MVSSPAPPKFRFRGSLRRLWARLPWASQRVWIEPYTLLSRQRLVALERSIHSVLCRGVSGDIVECGAGAGGSAALLALWLRRFKSTKQIHVFDTFEGLPPPTERDPDYGKAVAWTGHCRGELEQVRALFARHAILDWAVFIKGRFEDVLPNYAIPPIALLHLDGDWYDSTKICLTHLWDHLSPGGIMHIDDYGTWEGCRKAVDEFFLLRGIIEPLHVIDPEGRWVQKPALPG